MIKNQEDVWILSRVKEFLSIKARLKFKDKLKNYMFGEIGENGEKYQYSNANFPLLNPHDSIILDMILKRKNLSAIKC